MAQLNAGDVLAIVGGDVTRKPVLQCIGVKQMAGAPGAAPAAPAERYRLGVSDGQHWCSAMLATQLNSLVRNGSIDVGTMLRLDDYLVNTLNGRKLIIVLALEVVGQAPTVGKPINADALPDAGATAQVAVSSSSAVKADDKQPAAPAPGSAYGAPPPDPQQQYNGGFQQQQQQDNFSYGAAPRGGPVARADGPARVVPIASLNAYQNRWTIRGRVTMKSDVRHFQNARGEGKLFSFDLLDEHGGDIRCAGFGDAVDRWFDVVQPGSVISLSRASLKPRRPGPFNATSHDLEITLEPGSVLQVLPDVAEIPRQRYALRKLAALADAPPRTNVDVAGVVEAVAPATSITRRDGSEARKRSVTLRDDSGASVELTLWGSFADAALGDQLDGLVNGASSRPVLVGKALAVGDFGGGRTLSTAGSSVVTLDPPDVPEAAHLASWYSSGGAEQPFHSLSGGGSGGAGGLGGACQDRRVLVGDVAAEAAGGRVSWVQVAGTVSFVKQDAAYYPACPGAFMGKACNKKMQEDPSAAGGWSCGRCGHAGAPAWRYMLSMTLADHTGSTWVTAFNDEAAALLGVDAGALRALAGSAAHDAAFRPLLHADVVAKVKVFEEVYQDQARVKSSVQRIGRVADYAAEARAAMEMLARVEQGLAPTEAPAPDASAAAAGGAGMGGWGGGAPAAPAAAAAAPYGGDGGYGGGAPAAGGGGGGGGGVCYNCNQPGHFSRDCPSKQEGGGGGYGGGGGGGGGAAGGSVCYNCNQPGHFSRDCPSKQGGGGGGGGGYGGGGGNFRGGQGGGGGGGGGGSGVCYKCNQPGHWARDCPGGGGGGGGGGYGGGGAGMGGYGGF